MMARRGLLHRAAVTVREEGMAAAVTKVGARLEVMRDAAIARQRMRMLSRERQGPGLDRSLETAYTFAVGRVNIAPAQIRTEIRGFLESITRNSSRPQRLLEIGTAGGGTLFLLSRVAAADAALATIDLQGGEFGGGYAWYRAPLLKAIGRDGQTVKLIRGDSHDPRTVETARQWARGEALDVLFIDGDHRFEGVRLDFLTYGRMVRAGGVIALHDIVPGTAALVGEVPAFWNVLKDALPTREFVADWAQGGFGIGMVNVPREGLSGLSVADLPAPDSLRNPPARP